MELLERPDNAQMEAITKDLGEDLDRHNNNIKLLQKWVSCQNHLPQDYENNMLSSFLRACKDNLERAKRKFEMYFIVRAQIPEFFADRNPTRESLEKLKKSFTVAPLAKLSPNGERITIHRIENASADEFDVLDCVRYVFLSADLRIVEEGPISGDIFIYDLKNIQAHHVLNYMSSLSIARKAIMSANEAYPHRLKQCHMVNVPLLAEKGINFTKTFLKEKIKKRFIIHETPEGLLDYLPKETLPVEYGGTLGKFNDLIDDWSECLIKRKKWFQQQDTIKATGPIPERDYYFYEDIKGIEGSFRKLNID